MQDQLDRREERARESDRENDEEGNYGRGYARVVERLDQIYELVLHVLITSAAGARSAASRSLARVPPHPPGAGSIPSPSSRSPRRYPCRGCANGPPSNFLEIPSGLESSC